MAEPEKKPDKNPLDDMVNQLEKQVRKEADLRIIALTLEYRKLANQILTGEEMDICAGYFGMLLEDPQTQLSPEAAAVFQKLQAEPAIHLIFERLFTLIQAKIRARELEFSPRQVLSPILRGSGYEDSAFTDHPKSRYSKTS